MLVLGVSAFYHDAAAALIRDGDIVAAAQEERFTRRKNDADMPVNAIEYCLQEGDVGADGVDMVAYYEKPLTSFVRVLKTYTAIGPRGLRTFPKAMDEALRRKLWAAYEIDKTLKKLGYGLSHQTVYADHHMSHAAAAFYPSPFERAAILTFDGVGEWATSSIGVGNGADIELRQEMRFPDSIGLLYSAFTYAAGFRVNSGEYKLMGLAPYGEPTYRDRILSRLIELRDDGSFTMDMRFFDFLAGRRMTSSHFDMLFGGAPRSPDSPITRRECDLARSIQDVTEEIVMRMAHHAHELTGESDAVLAGGVALNCVANGQLLREGPFDRIWVQPAAGDAGSALGCALWAWHDVLGNGREDPDGRDSMQGALLGPTPTPASSDTPAWLDDRNRPYERLADAHEMAERLARLIADGAVVAVCRGRMEFGPRALGNRSILADARSPQMQRTLNLKVKFRESFRPFAPVVLEDRVGDWFAMDSPSPYMSIVAPVLGATIEEPSEPVGAGDEADLSARLAAVRSPIPAVTHVDGSARIQTVDAHRNPDLHRLLTAFDELTGCPVVVNTSFNVRGEPIVCDAEDAYRCFMATEIDYLVIDDCLLSKAEQPASGREAAVLLAD